MIYILLLLLSQCFSTFAMDSSGRAEILKELQDKIEAIVQTMRELNDGHVPEEQCRNWEQSIRSYWIDRAHKATTVDRVEKIKKEMIRQEQDCRMCLR